MTLNLRIKTFYFNCFFAESETLKALPPKLIKKLPKFTNSNPIQSLKVFLQHISVL
jgi:hypothetical protein